MSLLIIITFFIPKLEGAYAAIFVACEEEDQAANFLL